jgi:DNA polymerase
MKTLGIDIETFSSVNLIKSGVYPYVSSPDFEILLFGYQVDDLPPEIIDLASGEKLPEKILIALTSPYVLKTAHNVNFERTAISHYFKTSLPIEQWECTMVKASMLGLPMQLEVVARVLNVEQKDAAGKALIKYFTVPCKPTKVNGGRSRNLPEHAPEKWAAFKNYCLQDVIVEQQIRAKIAFFNITPTEKKMWQLDQQINDTGVRADTKFIKQAILMSRAYTEKITAEAKQITSLENPNSVAQLKQWIGEETGWTGGLTKQHIPEILQHWTTDKKVQRLLQLRQEMSKTSVKKYTAMLSGLCPDKRIRGLLQYYGANRTGRWAGRLVQVQNLPQNHLQDLDLARILVREGNLEMVEMLFGNVPDTLSQLIRTAFVAPDGSRLGVADFSAIEARVIAWLAGERWRLEVFSTHGKIYEASAAHMFKVPIEKVTKGSTYRQRAKIAELALGYGGGPDALISMGALKMGIAEEELPKLVAMWRNANKKICNYWREVDNAAVHCVSTRETVKITHGITFSIEKNILFITLPSGRKLSYLRPKIRMNQFDKPAVWYEGMNQTTKQWGLQQTYGGKLVENLCQAIARDCLVEAMIRLHDKGYKLVMHVHDEIVTEMLSGQGSLEEMNIIMSTPMPWAKGLPLTAESYETQYYKKD